MVYRPTVNPKLCFVLIPFHSPFLEYYEGIVKPAAEAAGLDALQADEIYGTGPIIQDIWGSIWSASIVVADVTGKNPNVNYELGICHTLGVPEPDPSGIGPAPTALAPPPAVKLTATSARCQRFWFATILAPAARCSRRMPARAPGLAQDTSETVKIMGRCDAPVRVWSFCDVVCDVTHPVGTKMRQFARVVESLAKARGT